MIMPDVLVVQPLHLDFPVFRWNMERFKKYFRSITIVFSNHHIENQDLSNFIKDKMPFCTFVYSIGDPIDWRNRAVNEGLDSMPQDGYVLFFEQDFLIKDDSFFDKVLAVDSDFIYFKENERIHPAFALVKRELVDKTSRDFSVFPPGDHFYKFFNELLELTKGVNIDDLLVKRKEDYVHMNGLSQNYMNFAYEDPFYEPANFLYYNYLSLKFSNQHPLFLGIQQAIEMKYGHSEHHVYMEKFFPSGI